MLKREQFIQTLLDSGVDKFLFMVPMRPLRTGPFGFITYTSSSDTETIVPCAIVQDRYPLSDNYKIELKSTLPQFGSAKFYVDDLVYMVRDGRICMYIKKAI